MIANLISTRVWRSAAGICLILIVAATAMAAPKKLPSFELTDLDGTRIKSTELLGGGPVLINFWATWCKPCLAEMPKLKAFHDEWSQRGLRVISVSIDDPRSQKMISPFVQRQGIEFPVYLDPNQDAHRRLGGNAVPFNVLVGSEGEILSVTAGYKDKDAKTWAELLAADLEAHPIVKDAANEAEVKGE